MLAVRASLSAAPAPSSPVALRLRRGRVRVGHRGQGAAKSMCQTSFQLPASCIADSRQPTATTARVPRSDASAIAPSPWKLAGGGCGYAIHEGEGVKGTKAWWRSWETGDGSGRRRARRGLSAGACACAFSLLSSFRAVMDRSLTSTSSCVGRWVDVDARTARASGIGACEVRARSLQVCESRGSTATPLHPLAPLAYTPSRASTRCGTVLRCMSTSALLTTPRTRWTI